MRYCVEKTRPSQAILEKLRRGTLTEKEKNALLKKHYSMARDTVVTYCNDTWLNDNSWLMKSNDCKKERG